MMRDFPPSAQEVWDILAKAQMLRAGGKIVLSNREMIEAANTEAEIELLDDGSISLRVERH